MHVLSIHVPAESSDISAEEEEEEEEGEGEGSNIICGQCVVLREIKDGKYRFSNCTHCNLSS